MDGSLMRKIAEMGNQVTPAASAFDFRKYGLAPFLGTEGARPYRGGGETINSPALLYKGKIYPGYNHSDALERAARATGKSFDQIYPKAREGFETSEGRFVSRKRAGEIDDDSRSAP